MGQRLTLVADAATVAARATALPDGLTMRPVTEADLEQLAQLYLSAYHPGPGASSLLEARTEMRATFAGEFGPLWLGASPVIVDADGMVLASIQTVTDAPAEWAAPAGPYVIELWTAYLARGQGLASALLAEAARAVVAAGRDTLALRVDPDNVGALRLYASVGFTGAAEVDTDALERARSADVSNWRAALEPRRNEAPRTGWLRSADGVSSALAVLAVLAVVGTIAAIIGLAVLLVIGFMSVFGDPAPSESPSPTPTATSTASTLSPEPDVG